MLKRIEDMPAGTLGFEAVGEVEDDDWEEVVEPTLKEWIAQGGKVRMLYLLGPKAREVEDDAMTKDLGFRARHASRFERVAVVGDEDWMRPHCRPSPSCCRGRPRPSGPPSSSRRKSGWERTERPAAETPSRTRRATRWSKG